MSAVRFSRAEVRQLRDRLPDRDLQILTQLAELRVMSGRQIEAVHFPSESHATNATAALDTVGGYWHDSFETG